SSLIGLPRLRVPERLQPLLGGAVDFGLSALPRVLLRLDDRPPEERPHLFTLGRLLGGEVIRLATLLRDIVELLRREPARVARVRRDELPRLRTDRLQDVALEVL